VGTETRRGILWEWRQRVTYRGYDVVAISPRFLEASFGGDWGKGEGELTVSYSGTSEAFWRIVPDLAPIAIMSFTEGKRPVMAQSSASQPAMPLSRSASFRVRNYSPSQSASARLTR